MPDGVVCVVDVGGVDHTGQAGHCPTTRISCVVALKTQFFHFFVKHISSISCDDTLFEINLNIIIQFI